MSPSPALVARVNVVDRNVDGAFGDMSPADVVKKGKKYLEAASNGRPAVGETTIEVLGNGNSVVPIVARRGAGRAEEISLIETTRVDPLRNGYRICLERRVTYYGETTLTNTVTVDVCRDWTIRRLSVGSKVDGLALAAALARSFGEEGGQLEETLNIGGVGAAAGIIAGLSMHTSLKSSPEATLAVAVFVGAAAAAALHRLAIGLSSIRAAAAERYGSIVHNTSTTAPNAGESLATAVGG